MNSIIIPARGNSLGLWATVHSIVEDLESSHLIDDFEFVIVTNGEEVPKDTMQTIELLQIGGKLGAHVHCDEPLSPPVARQRGVNAAKADNLLFFFDNHCLVGRQYFERALMDMKVGDKDMLHSTTRFYLGDHLHYNYVLTLDYNFWGKSEFYAQTHKPYQIALAGHGGFLVTRDAWEAVGGYGPEGLLKGYGGEEPLFDLKMWRYGRTNWIDPKLIHYHYTGVRGYSRHFTDDYYINMLACANVIGGEKWLYKVFDSFITKKHVRPIRSSTLTKYEILQAAVDRSDEYAKIVDAKSVRTLDECLSMFSDTQVAM